MAQMLKTIKMGDEVRVKLDRPVGRLRGRRRMVLVIDEECHPEPEVGILGEPGWYAYDDRLDPGDDAAWYFVAWNGIVYRQDPIYTWRHEYTVPVGIVRSLQKDAERFERECQIEELND